MSGFFRNFRLGLFSRLRFRERPWLEAYRRTQWINYSAETGLKQIAYATLASTVLFTFFFKRSQFADRQVQAQFEEEYDRAQRDWWTYVDATVYEEVPATLRKEYRDAWQQWRDGSFSDVYEKASASFRVHEKAAAIGEKRFAQAFEEKQSELAEKRGADLWEAVATLVKENESLKPAAINAAAPIVATRFRQYESSLALFKELASKPELEAQAKQAQESHLAYRKAVIAAELARFGLDESSVAPAAPAEAPAAPAESAPAKKKVKKVIKVKKSKAAAAAAPAPAAAPAVSVVPAKATA
jgi:hypothetical protein